MESPTVRALWIRAATGVARALVALSCIGLISAEAAPFSVTITAKPTDTGTFSGGFRYTIQEDPTFDHTPDATGLSGNNQDTLSLAFHKSHAKVVKVGHSPGATVSGVVLPDDAKRYFVTVMPDNPGFAAGTPSGYTMNGTAIRPGATSVSVPVNPLPFKTDLGVCVRRQLPRQWRARFAG
jgi:hypothetical protein